MTTHLRLAPSILTADFARLADELSAVAPHVDLFHLDVMDGHYVENITFGADIVAAIARTVDVPLHVHLMIEDPALFAPRFAEAGASRISFHPEVVADPGAVLEVIGATGAGAGFAVHPDIELDAVDRYLDHLEVIIMMTVRPGWGGQKFLEQVVPKIARARALLDDRGSTAEIEVDGGVNLSTIETAVNAGATNIVAGSAIFDGKDPAAAAKRLRERLNELQHQNRSAGRAVGPA